jgi:hypothetical protein
LAGDVESIVNRPDCNGLSEVASLKRRRSERSQNCHCQTVSSTSKMVSKSSSRLNSFQISVTFNLNRVRTFERRRKGKRPLLSHIGAAQSRPERIQELQRLGCSCRFIASLKTCSFNTLSRGSAPKSPMAKISRPKKITAEVSNYIDTLSSLDSMLH